MEDSGPGELPVVTPSAADHIFARRLERIAAGKVKSVRASDHFPLWVVLGT